MWFLHVLEVTRWHGGDAADHTLFQSRFELLSQVPCVDETGPCSIQKSVSSEQNHTKVGDLRCLCALDARTG